MKDKNYLEKIMEGKMQEDHETKKLHFDQEWHEAQQQLGSYWNKSIWICNFVGVVETLWKKTNTKWKWI